MGSTSVVAERSSSAGAKRRAARARQRSVRRRRRAAIGAGVLLGVGGLVAGIIAIAGGGGDEAAASGTQIDLALGDYFIAGDLEVPAGEVRLHATNVGIEPHDVGVRGKGITTTLFSGQSADLDLVLEPGTYELFCDIGDHVARGMVATLVVTEPPPAPAV